MAMETHRRSAHSNKSAVESHNSGNGQTTGLASYAELDSLNPFCFFQVPTRVPCASDESHQAFLEKPKRYCCSNNRVEICGAPMDDLLRDPIYVTRHRWRIVSAGGRRFLFWKYTSSSHQKEKREQQASIALSRYASGFVC